jgi:hypothetical protein
MSKEIRDGQKYSASETAALKKSSTDAVQNFRRKLNGNDTTGVFLI